MTGADKNPPREGTSPPARSLLAFLAFAAPFSFLAALLLWIFPSQSVAPVVHVVLAAGIMPLIMGAMIYFIPVLTRSRAASLPVLLIPVLALCAGLLVAMSIFRWREWIPAAALLGMVSTAGLLAWAWRRARAMLGRPHPGLHWYLLALISLLLGLLVIFIAAMWPQYWPALRRFHLHMNIFGFIGLTAVGTLHVLIPTVAGYADAKAGERLRRDLAPMAVGALLMAAGAAWWREISWLGLALWMIPLTRFLTALFRRRENIRGWHRPAFSLSLAVAGLVVVLVSGALHAADISAADVSLPLLFYFFLFPLVTGAISYLLPVWLWAGRNEVHRLAAARRLQWGSGARALVFIAAGALAWSGMPGAVYLALAVMGLFLGQVILAVFTRFSAAA